MNCLFAHSDALHTSRFGRLFTMLLVFVLASGCALASDNSIEQLTWGVIGWAWYWQLLLFLALCVGLVIIGVVVFNASSSSESRFISFVLGIFLLFPLAAIVYDGGKMLYLLANIQALGIAAGIAFLGSLIVRGVSGGAYGRSGTHEWEIFKGWQV